MEDVFDDCEGADRRTLLHRNDPTVRKEMPCLRQETEILDLVVMNKGWRLRLSRTIRTIQR
jgi:hypothetical protein